MEALSQQIKAEHQALTKEQQEKDSIIQQLRDATVEVQQLVHSEHRFLKSEIKAKHTSLVKSWERMETDLMDEIQLYKAKLSQEEAAHESIMEFLDLQRQQLESDSSKWSSKYEQDILAKSRQLEDLKNKRISETDEFEQLVVEYEVLEKFNEDYRVKKAAKEAEDLRRRLADRASKKIQRWWRKLVKKRKVSLSHDPLNA